MNRTLKKILSVLAAAVLAVMVLSFAACGKGEDEGALTPTGELELKQFSLSASTWSSPNGATIHLTATPSAYFKGCTADFLARMEGEEITRAACEWDGTQYTASLDLNAADGYCYYVVLAAGSYEAEIPVNTPTEGVMDAKLMDLAAALEADCELAVEGSSFEGRALTITAGTAQIQAPRILNDGQAITCTQVMLALTSNGEGVATALVPLVQPNGDGLYELDLAGVSFQIPASDDDQQLILEAHVDLSNGQTLSATGSSWLCTGDEATLLTVG